MLTCVCRQPMPDWVEIICGSRSGYWARFAPQCLTLGVARLMRFSTQHRFGLLVHGCITAPIGSRCACWFCLSPIMPFARRLNTRAARLGVLDCRATLCIRHLLTKDFPTFRQPSPEDHANCVSRFPPSPRPLLRFHAACIEHYRTNTGSKCRVR